jgi:hypothetical protein
MQRNVEMGVILTGEDYFKTLGMPIKKEGISA